MDTDYNLYTLLKFVHDNVKTSLFILFIKIIKSEPLNQKKNHLYILL